MKKFLVLLIAFLMITPEAFADSIFVGTDRHAHYETVKAEEPYPEGETSPEEKRPPRKKVLPAYDENGNLIWHNNLTDVLKLVAADGVDPAFFLIGGDNVGEGGSGSKDATGFPMGAFPYSVKALDAQVHSVFGAEAVTLYTYGSHDANATDAYQAAFFSGPVAGDGYYIYGISFSQMTHDTDGQASGYDGKDTEDPNGLCAQTASQIFLSWVRSLEDHYPIVVMSHVPLHAHRGDNLGAWTWTRALNAAAEEHDIIFLWGHNHTTEKGENGRALERANYLRLPGETLTVQSWERNSEGNSTGFRVVSTEDGEEARQPVAQTEKLGFLYMNAGYITNGVGTVLTFDEDQLTVRRYALTEEEEAEPFVYELRHWE